MFLLKTIGVLCLLTSFGIALHQYLVWGVWFEWEEISLYHHESGIVIFAFCGILLLFFTKGK